VRGRQKQTWSATLIRRRLSDRRNKLQKRGEAGWRLQFTQITVEIGVIVYIVAFANGYARPCARIIFSAQKCIGILYPKAKPSDTHITILSIFLKPNQCNQPCHEHMLHSGSRDQSESFSPIGSSCPTGRCHAWHLCRLYTKIFGHVPGVQPSLQTKV